MSYTGFFDELRKIPPVTRFLCASSVAVTVPVMLQLLSPYRVLFVRELVTQKWEIWRVWTSFFLGSSGFNYIFDIIMLYRNSDSLESGQFSGRSPDYAWQLILAAGAILGLNIPLRTYVHARALLLCTTYLSAALSPAEAQTSFMGLITFPVKYFPYALLAMDLVTGGPNAAAVSVTGLVVGHLWWWTMFGDDGRGLPGVREWGNAPGWLRNLVASGAGPNPGAGTGVHVIPPRPRQERTGGGRATGYQWGSGQRLGED
ncbi:hypothetical protein HETIRDRAFT_329528 [Heterobasidion irregulare TC 32-1]|uniref:Derlin n=1 Tax=Heterobasidion irregulare (strain TC 32-1) TaxID=747525 RepID=W4JQI0_HETIT|nr:uncharacterized protein HETIRDRAFT_329528 [Heterobasidion irregulare TC 32-1]ETW75778.1 hypothetical protein HETIRDRAFT_329528 [Heterobasidion irregulare TC 32-1]